MLARLRHTRGLPQIVRTDNGISLRLIEPGKLNAYIESFNERLHDECLNDHCFITLAHA